MPSGNGGEDTDFQIKLANRVAELRLQVDLGDLRTPAAFRAALERGGQFLATDPQVREACTRAGLARWFLDLPDT